MTLRHLTAALLALGLFTSIMLLAEYDQKRRVERLGSAETKYGATYQGSALDGEGGGTWSLPDGTTQTCRISGGPADPRLLCGADQAEPAPASP